MANPVFLSALLPGRKGRLVASPRHEARISHVTRLAEAGGSWSPDQLLLVMAGRVGHLVLSAMDLREIAGIEGRDAGGAAFSPDGRFLCLCRMDNSAVVPVASLGA